VADAPKFKLSKCIDAGGGFQLANWGTHASTTARASTPSNLLNEVQTRFGTHAVGECDAVDHHPRALCRLRRNVVTGVNQHGEVFRWLMRERQWDVFLAGFSASHCIGHHFWHGTDESHPRYDEAVAAGIDGAIEEVYCAIDRELGELIAAAGPHAQVMVFSAHGMGPLYHASWNLPEIIDLLGYGRQAPRKRERNESRDAKVNPWRILKTTLPGALQYRIKAMLPKAMQDQLLFLWYSGGRQWAGSRAFAVPNNDAVGSIRLAVKGRDKYGLIEPGEEYRRVRNDIADALYGLTDPVSGRPVIKRVAYVHDEYKGPFANQLPDLTVLWDQSFAWSSLHSQRIGTLRIRAQDARTGGHTAYGFLLATGPHVACGARIYGGSLYDIAPTVLETAGVAAPRDLDGRALRLQSAEAHT
jgi:predicted AlkP superfamily phosphohydrolase/phosphomutase